MSAMTRGPLPAAVYWRRRLLLLVIVFALVFAVARLVGGGAEEEAGASARQAVGDATSSVSPAPSEQASGATATSAPTSTVPEPTGPCADGEVLITPAVPTPVAGQDIAVVLNLQSSSTEVCTFALSSDSVTLSITSGPDDIWLSTECPQVLPTEDVVVRRAAPTPVEVVWNARRSDEGCTGRTAWALPGFYHVTAAALGSEPTDVQFELEAPTAVPPAPEAAPGAKASAKPTAKAAAKPATKNAAPNRPTPKPSGAVEPDQLSGE